MSVRNSRVVEVALPRPRPSDAFLESGTIRNAKARARIVEAGAKVIACGSWPTQALVLEANKKIRSATLERNSDALDPARREWISAVGLALVAEGTFPTAALLRERAGAVRSAVLSRFEDALTSPRRLWVATNGPHPDWIDPEDAAAAANETASDIASGEDQEAVQTTPPSKGRAPAVADLAQRQIARLMKERAADRERIAELEKELAMESEKTRRALLGVQKKHAVYLNEAETRKKA